MARCKAIGTEERERRTPYRGHEITGHDGAEQATKIPEIAEFLALPAAPIGATAADFCAVLAELHVESRQALRSRFALPFLGHQR
jgi:hypothetical protein